MASKARIYDNLLLMIRFCEFEKEDLGREVVDIGDSEGNEGIRELVGDDLSSLVDRSNEAETDTYLDI